METALTLKKQNRDALYDALNNDSVKVRDGIEGHPEFGRTHPLLNTMGFVTERKSGLTRRKKETKPATT
jgi:hypothetical protein